MKKAKIVCFGGGTCLPTLLSGLKKNPHLEISVVVTMFDTGGSSGELKDKFGILPPGDILKCLLALSKNETATRDLLLKRINNYQSPGHTGGNILLLGLEKVFGSLNSAVDALGQILSASGKVYPVTFSKSTLYARFDDGSTFKGETNIDMAIYEGKKISDLYLDPQIDANPSVLEVIEEADILCIGPGSFYTSVLPNFLPKGVKDKITSSKSEIIFICNLLTEGYGMKNLTVQDIVRNVEDVYIGRPISKIVVNSAIPITRLTDYAQERKYPIYCDPDPRIVLDDLWLDSNLARHDPDRLAYLVGHLIYQLKS